jgi:glycosyltransferase involved in cell wall biosynthesis
MDSVLRQSFESFEVMVIDDGSTDGTGEMLREFGDPRVRVVRNERRRGLVYALNAGMELARGEYIARMDGDDVSHLERFAAQVRFLDRETDVALVGTWANVINEAGDVVSVMRVPTSSREIYEALLLKNVFIHPSVMFRKRAVQELGGYQPVRANTELAQDYHLWLRLADRYSLANLAEVLIDYRMHRDQVSMQRLVAQLKSADLARRMAAKRRAEHGRPGGGRRGLRLIERLRGERGSLGGECLFLCDVYRSGEDRGIVLRLAWQAVLSSPLSRQAWDLAGRELARRMLGARGVRTLRAWLTGRG